MNHVGNYSSKLHRYMNVEGIRSCLSGPITLHFKSPDYLWAHFTGAAIYSLSDGK